MNTQELTQKNIHIPEFHNTQSKSNQPINDNLILTIIFILGFLGAIYILNIASSPSTVNSQGYTIEYSSMSK